jgi:hypothetical protein
MLDINPSEATEEAWPIADTVGIDAWWPGFSMLARIQHVYNELFRIF